MSVELYPYEPAPGVELLTTWLRPLYPASAFRKPGDALPSYVVTCAGGTDDKLTDSSIYTVNSFAESFTDAEDAALLAHRRILLLGPPYAGQQQVSISGGRVATPDVVRTDQRPRYEFYSDTIWRFVARYRVDLRFTAA